MSTVQPAFCVAAAQQCLASANKKPALPSSVCLNLAAQVQAVDLGLKPALLYDANSAGPDQILRYLSVLQGAGLLTGPLRVLAIGDDTLVVNLNLVVSHLEELLLKKSVIVMDVSQGRGQPKLTDMERCRVPDLILGILDTLRALMETGSPLVATVREDLYGGWNLCTLFGVLLGYPATYWFEQSPGMENCLDMTPLRVIKASAMWKTVAGGSNCNLYSFSVPEALKTETRGALDGWVETLRGRFSLQSAFAGLTVSTETMTLPAVAL